MEYALKTKRLDLRVMQIGDADSLFHLHSDNPEAVRFTTWHPVNVAEAMSALYKLRQQFRDGQSVLWAIRTQEDQTFIGLLHLAEIHDGEGAVHFIIARPNWGHGIGPEALAAVLTSAKGSLGLRRIRGRCYPENIEFACLREGWPFRRRLRPLPD